MEYKVHQIVERKELPEYQNFSRWIDIGEVTWFISLKKFNPADQKLPFADMLEKYKPLEQIGAFVNEHGVNGFKYRTPIGSSESTLTSLPSSSWPDDHILGYSMDVTDALGTLSGMLRQRKTMERKQEKARELEPPKPPQHYRLREEGEIVEDGDLMWDIFSDEWEGVNDPRNAYRVGFVANDPNDRHTVKYCYQLAQKENTIKTYKKPLPSIIVDAQKIDEPTYRLLTEGETVEESDEEYCTIRRAWCPTMMAGEKAQDPRPQGATQYRRKVIRCAECDCEKGGDDCNWIGKQKS